MEADDASLRDWVGRSETARDWIAPERCRALQATLDRMDTRVQDGDPLPPLWHWLYFWTIAPRSGLGRDGHPVLGGFLPPVGTAKRMWAGSRVGFLAPIKIGDHAERVSTIASIVPKRGRTGRLVFVTIRHEITGPDGLAIVDEHDIVYRDIDGKESGGRPGVPAPSDATYVEPIKADPAMLFRYSALTFNGHRIHYDRDYATGTEGYSGLVVHGPLLATLLVDLAVRSWHGRRLARFAFRAHRPVIDTDPFTLCGSPQSETAMDLWVADIGGLLAMTAEVEFLEAA